MLADSRLIDAVSKTWRDLRELGDYRGVEVTKSTFRARRNVDEGKLVRMQSAVRVTVE